jgi:hypothetical protein
MTGMAGSWLGMVGDARRRTRGIFFSAGARVPDRKAEILIHLTPFQFMMACEEIPIGRMEPNE